MEPGTECNGTHQITVDGIDYSVEVEHGGDVLWIYGINGVKVADAEHDHAVEQVFVSYFDEEGVTDSCSAPRELFDKPWREVAEWIVSTFPGY